MPQPIAHAFHLNHQIFPSSLKVLFVAKIFHAIGMNLAIFFLPLYLYSVGRELPFLATLSLTPFQMGMLFMGGFFFIQRLLILFTSIPISVLISKIGVRNGLIFGQLLNVIILGLFSMAGDRPELFALILLLEAIKIPLFWTSYFSLFSTFAIYEKMGMSVGTIEFFTRLIQVAIPAVTGFVIMQFGFPQLFLFGMTFHLLSVAILLLMEERPVFGVPSLQEFISWLKEQEFRKLSVSIFGKYFADSLQFLWPFFVFLLIGSVERVGVLYSLVFFLSLLAVYFVGWFVDHNRSLKPFNISGVLIGAVWVGRAYATTIWGIIVIDTFDKLAQSVYSPFYESLLLRRGKGSGALAYFTYREIIISLSGILFWAVFAIYFLFFDTWSNFLLLGVLGMLCSLQLRDRQTKIGARHHP